jgi:hypothetical protein
VDFQEQARDIDIYVCSRSRHAREILSPAEEWFLALCFAQEADIKCGHCGLVSILNPRCGESHLPGRFFARSADVFSTEMGNCSEWFV